MGLQLKPQFVVDGINLSRDISVDNDDHTLDNAWFLAAIATLQTRSHGSQWMFVVSRDAEAEAEAALKSTASASLLMSKN